MFKRLRIQFIALNVLTAAGIILVAFAAIYLMDHQRSVNDAYSTLRAALEQAEQQINLSDTSAFPPAFDFEEDEESEDESSEDTLSSDQSSTPPEIGGKGSDQVTPVAIYFMAEDGSLSAITTEESTASIADDVLETAQEELLATEAEEGELAEAGLIFVKSTTPSGTYIAFADSSEINNWTSLVPILTAVGVAAIILFVVVAAVFSLWALRPVKQAWQTQQQFVADASHDLKTPITVILADAAIVLEHPERSVASQKQWLESIQHEGKSMQALVSDLLLLAQTDEKSSVHQFESLDFSELVQRELLQFESIAFENNVSLETQLQEGLRVQGDATRLRRLVATLADNACKYAGSGGNVQVALNANGKFCMLTVRNDGTLIPAEDLPHVFDRFYRADKARTRDKEGHGLGLAIAQAIAQEHGGSIEARSNDKEGTVFTLKLPRDRK